MIIDQQENTYDWIIGVKHYFQQQYFCFIVTACFNGGENLLHSQNYIKRKTQSVNRPMTGCIYQNLGKTNDEKRDREHQIYAIFQSNFRTKT